MEKRTSKRQPSAEVVAASFGTFDVELPVVDLSADGCQLEVSGTVLRPGYAIALFFAPGLVTTGTVVWQRGFHAGVKFQRKLRQAVVDQLALEPVLVEVERNGPIAA